MTQKKPGFTGCVCKAILKDEWVEEVKNGYIFLAGSQVWNLVPTSDRRIPAMYAWKCVSSIFHIRFFLFRAFGITYLRTVIVLLYAHFYEDNLYIHALGLNPTRIFIQVLVHCNSLDSTHFCSTTFASRLVGRIWLVYRRCIHLLITFIFPLSICRPWKNIRMSSP